MDMLRWAGFAVVWSKIVDASEQGPVCRPRWICLARRVADPQAVKKPFGFWERPLDFVPASFGCKLNDTHLLQDPRLEPSPSMLVKSARHDMLPPAKRACVDPLKVLESRCYSALTKISYRHVHVW